MTDSIEEAAPVLPEQTPNPVEVAIPISDRQAATLSKMLLVRETADREVSVYASALIAGSSYESGEFVGIRQLDGITALILRVS